MPGPGHRIGARLLGAAVLMLIAACGPQQSGLNANASVTISGKALGGDGQPLANNKVVLIKELDLGETIGGLFVMAASLGLACLADHPPAICANNSHAATTDANGSYSFSIKGGDTQGSVGLASTIEVVARGQARASEIAGALAFEEFTVQTASLTLPDLRIWQPAVTPAWSSAGERAAWPALPGAYGGSPIYALEFYDLRHNPWWMSGPVKRGEWVEGRILEDLHGAVDVVAHAHGTASGTTVISGSVGVQGYAGPPPSRNAPCAYVASSGVGSFNSGCCLTSGDLGNHKASTGGSTGVVIDLGHDQAVSFAVVRGCTGQCKVSVSSDHTSWSAAGTVTGPYATAPITLNRSARYVRLEGSVGELRQLSVW